MARLSIHAMMPGFLLGLCNGALVHRGGGRLRPYSSYADADYTSNSGVYSYGGYNHYRPEYATKSYVTDYAPETLSLAAGLSRPRVSYVEGGSRRAVDHYRPEYATESYVTDYAPETRYLAGGVSYVEGGSRRAVGHYRPEYATNSYVTDYAPETRSLVGGVSYVEGGSRRYNGDVYTNSRPRTSYVEDGSRRRVLDYSSPTRNYYNNGVYPSSGRQSLARSPSYVTVKTD